MGPEHPHPSLSRSTSPPKKAPCPKCGKLGRRNRTFTRRVRTVAYKQAAYLEITSGGYGARCGCRKTFRNSPEGVLPRAIYDNKVHDIVLDRVLHDGMSIERTLQSLRREFLLDLSTGFVVDVLHDRARQLAMSEHRREVLERFRGTLCIDERHLGRFTLLLATDPLADLPVAFAVVEKNDRDHRRRYLRNLRNRGLNPTVVVTDDSNLDPAVPDELWPEADHQRCVFHVIKDINGLILDAVRRLRSAMSRRGRPEEEARPQGGQVEGRHGMTRHDAQGEGGFRVQTPLPDRETAGEPHRVGA